MFVFPFRSHLPVQSDFLLVFEKTLLRDLRAKTFLGVLGCRTSFSGSKKSRASALNALARLYKNRSCRCCYKFA